MNISNRKLFVIALIFGILAAAMVYLYLAKIEAENKKVEPSKNVITAKITIPPRTQITREMIEIKEIKISSIPSSAYTIESDVIGQVAKETIYQGEPIIHERIADDVYRKVHLTYSIPKGYRALTIQYNPVVGVGGFIQSGDYVDLIGTYDDEQNNIDKDTAKVIVQNILVLAVGSKNDGEINQQQSLITTITLAVTPEAAEKITLTDEKAAVRLMLRPLNEKGSTSTAGSTVDNILTPQGE